MFYFQRSASLHVETEDDPLDDRLKEAQVDSL